MDQCLQSETHHHHGHLSILRDKLPQKVPKIKPRDDLDDVFKNLAKPHLSLSILTSVKHFSISPEISIA